MSTEKITFKLPPGFDPQVHLKALEALVAKKHGDGFDIDFIDPEEGYATASRHVTVASISATTERSATREVRLPKDTKATDGEKVAAKMLDEFPNYAMTTFDPHLKRATLTLMDAAVRRARDAVAVALGVKPWSVGITPRPDGGYDLELPRTYVPSKHDA
ncbi:cell division FtsK/SpoIIIE, partial [mine drainage metagenome]